MQKTFIPYLILSGALAGCGSDSNTPLFENGEPLGDAGFDAATANHESDGASRPDGADSVSSDATRMPGQGDARSDGNVGTTPDERSGVDAPTASDAFTAADATSDAAGPTVDAAAMNDLCDERCARTGIGTCEAGACVIRCTGTNDCSGRLECPPGVACRVVCAGDGSCAGGIDCTQAAACDIQCSGMASCPGIVQCGGSRCSVGCVEHGSCQRPVACGADDCQLSCTGPSACGGGVACLASTKNCSIDCGGAAACGASVQGSGASEIKCSGFASCPLSVACAGPSCAILCVMNQSCGGSVCCESAACTYEGTPHKCD